MTNRPKDLSRREFIRDGAVFGAGLMAMNALGKVHLNDGGAQTSAGMPAINPRAS
jgi:hypothetical protein